MRDRTALITLAIKYQYAITGIEMLVLVADGYCWVN